MAPASRRLAVLLAAGFCALAAGARAQEPAPTIPPDTVITLERNGCGGPCPRYRVTIDAKGAVEYDGLQFVRVEGTRRARVATRVVADLLDAAHRAGFFDLADRYRTLRNRRGESVLVTDLPEAFLTITTGGRTKRVEDYLGTPESLRQLEARIDAATRTRRWTNVDPLMLANLRASGRVLTQDELMELLERAVSDDDSETVTALLDAGADPNTGRAGPSLMGANSARVVRALLAGGADPLVRLQDGATPLHHAAYLEPAATIALMKAGAPVDSVDLRSRTPLIDAACAGNAAVVAILLAAGANPAARSDTTTPLACAEEARAHQDDSIPTPGVWLVPDYDGVVVKLRAALAARPSK